MGGLAGGGMAGALSGTGLSMATQALLTGATAGVYGGSTARLLSGSGITPVTVTQDALLGGAGGLVTYGVASAYRQATAPKPSTTSLQERANLAAQLSEAEGCASGTAIQGVGNPVTIEGRGSTGRTTPNTLNEQMAIIRRMD